MGILDRAASIIKANINDLLDKAEDPAKMIDQYLIEMQDDLAQVKRETAGVMAEEQRSKRAVEECSQAVAKYDKLARTALSAGEEDDARTFLREKQEHEAKLASLQESYASAKANADKMREMHDKLVDDINELKGRREAVKAKVAVAKTTEKVNKMTSGADKMADSMGAFERMEEKADRMLDEANAISQLSSRAADPLAQLEDKYASANQDAGVEDELAKLKREMGLDQ
ncbi:PspA/IM30 family protein [Xiamenia xianingshaonis]|uniref:PspA/IM30 family protein n=1 Tax=Xiamenia xianingshaonis TaxID=2682776 RepID=A0A9E6SU88_9ACTN|nr:PspA/IM30 family protein [Xiamenia xianingshaonis]NHM14670.1 PspA/IM30 family protein [Xiamenia xianingshaonis]NHM16355.1 PspA/IM30 family protein [Xiamenia xianingshaonis]QTU84295.1 PspA/IM30 family protein [Xiamenia xianingshaonis]